MIITVREVEDIRKLNVRGKIFVDFGKKEVVASMAGENAVIDGITVEKKYLDKIAKNRKKAFLVEKDNIYMIQFFDDTTNKFYKLRPSSRNNAPTIEISGKPVHVRLGIDPMGVCKRKIDCISPVKGVCLDTCLGIGYTAKLLCENGADKVISFEARRAVLDIIEVNPWSSDVLENEKIDIRIENAAEGIKEFRNGFFDIVVHEPPSYRSAVDLYQEGFYEELYRVMKIGGKLYHYVETSRKKSLDTVSAVRKRLEKAGFRNIRECYEGYVAVK